MKPLSLLLLFLALTSYQKSCSQNSQQKYCCMFYNVENLFHPSDDPHTRDDDFTPDGERRWTFYRYNKKITEICKVILAVNQWNPPSFICLSEIENEEVLKDIIYHPLLIKNKYRILHRDSPDRRGIDVAILFRTDHATCIDTTWITIKDETGRTINTRDILIAKFVINKDTLLIAANHWTSKYGGALETEAQRILQARILGAFVDSVVTAQASASIIAGGDLNDLGGSVPLQVLKNDFSLHHILLPSGESTYKYQGRWGSVDHVFIAGRLSPENCSAFIPKIPFLVEKDEKYTGERPRRTYRGYAYSGGISDHLPLLLFFQIPY
ncbi:MAG: hypothetical protein LC655_01075 [Bacteroidales bacterium]|nr:hypothetical protein [Bacteroidales bacterium]